MIFIPFNMEKYSTLLLEVGLKLYTFFTPNLDGDAFSVSRQFHSTPN
jgi:hypothetical protein